MVDVQRRETAGLDVEKLRVGCPDRRAHQKDDQKA